MPPRRRPDVLFERLADGSGVLVDPVSGSTHALNASGVAIWELCDGRRDPAAIARSDRKHTSELQSHHDLVCRLLLEKKKKIICLQSDKLRQEIKTITRGF